MDETDATLRSLTRYTLRSWEEQLETSSLFTRCLSLSALPVGDIDGDRLAAWQSRLQAVELSALLRIVDPVGWARLLGESGFANTWRLGLHDHQVPAYDIAFEPDDSAEYIDSVLALVLAPAEDRAYDQEFLDTKSRILASTSDPEVLDAVREMRIPIRIVDGLNRVETSEHVHGWFQRAGNQTLSSSPFVLTSVVVKPHRLNMTPTLIEKVHRHVAAHVPLDHVKFAVRPRDDPPPRLEFGKFLADIMGPRGAKAVQCARVDHRLTREAFSSVLVGPNATTPHALDIVNTGSSDSVAERCSQLLWILYGIFSQDARHSIDTLFFPICSGIQSQELEWLHNLLQTQAAPRMELLIPEVFDEYVSREPPSSDLWITVPRGCSIRLEERDDWQSHALRFGEQDMSLRVIRDDPTSAFIDVLVPGYGRCWIERTDSLCVVDKPLTPWRFDQHTIQSLELALLSVLEDEQRTVAAFLRLVGAPVKMLRLHRIFSDEPPSGLEESLLSSIVRSCPQLERLVLHSVSPVNANALLRTFEQPNVSMQGLVFESQPFQDRSELLLFLEALCDASRAITKCLRELAIDLIHYENERSDASDVIEAVLRLLETNNRLRIVHVGLSVAQQARYGSRFHAHRDRFISRAKAPVSMRAKCALLSAMGTRVPVMDTMLLSHVFAFAAECETREVTVGTSFLDGYIRGRPNT